MMMSMTTDQINSQLRIQEANLPNSETIEIELNNDHVTFMRALKDNYNIPTESKVMRIIMDYLQENKDVHDTVFKQTRCLRCE